MTFRLDVVVRAPPMRPDIRMPLSTRPGVLQAPMEPGERWRSDWPCVAGPPRKLWRFMVPANPLAFARANHIHALTFGEDVDEHLLAHIIRLVLAHAQLTQVAQGRQVLLAQVAEARAVQLARRHFVKPELDGRVAVARIRLALRNVAGPRFDDSDRSDTTLRVEHLGHANFLSENAFHVSFGSEDCRPPAASSSASPSFVRSSHPEPELQIKQSCLGFDQR